MKTILVVLVLPLMTGCVVYGPPYPPGYGYGAQQEMNVQEGAAHLNRVVDPAIVSRVYPTCIAGEWKMSATTGNEGNRFTGHASQTCKPAYSRFNNEDMGVEIEESQPQGGGQ